MPLFFCWDSSTQVEVQQKNMAHIMVYSVYVNLCHVIRRIPVEEAEDTLHWVLVGCQNIQLKGQQSHFAQRSSQAAFM